MSHKKLLIRGRKMVDRNDTIMQLFHTLYRLIVNNNRIMNYYCHSRWILILIPLFLCLNSSAQLYINEFLTSNTQTNYNTRTEFVDWIEIYNAGSASVNLNGYYFSDDSTEFNKWQVPVDVYVPANGHALIWADNLDWYDHTNFGLSKDGEYISFSSPSGVVIDKIKYRPQFSDISYGRETDGDSNWGFFFNPTPGNPNNSIFYQEPSFAGEPIFSITGGIYSGQQTVLLSASSPTAEIRYTLDGSLPSKSTFLYSSPIIIDTNSIIRAQIFDTLTMPGKVVSHSYFIGINHELPVMSLITTPRNLWNDTIGIYCIGTNGLFSYGVEANYWHEWERPANVEFFEQDGTQVINQIAGIEINGQRRNMGQKSLRLFARNRYGKKQFEHKFFFDKNINGFSSLVLRNAGYKDYASTHIRDGLGKTIISGRMDIETQAHRPCVVYINGIYWGIYNIREKQNEEYLTSNTGVNPGNVDILENADNTVVEGENTDYEILLRYLENNNVNTTESYEYICDNIDVDNYINYLIAQIYLGNMDWPMLNIKYWKEKNETGKWRWLLYDLDAGMGIYTVLGYGYDYDMISHATATDVTGWPNPPESTYFFRKLLENDQFRNEFIQRTAAHINTTFLPSRTHQIIDSMKTNIATEMPNQISRWKDIHSTDGTCVQSYNLWEQEIDLLKDYFNQRPQYVIDHIKNKFNISSTLHLTSNSVQGHIEINTVPLPEGTYTGEYFINIPMRLKAIPKPGYKFAYWTGCSNSTSDEINMTFNADDQITAIFEPVNYQTLPCIFNTNDTLYSSQSPYIGVCDVTINPGVTLVIEAGVKILMQDSLCINVEGNLIINGTSNMPVTIDAYTETGSKKWGALCFYNATDSSQINNLFIRNASIGRIDTLQIGAISSYNSNLIINGLNIKNSLQPFYSEFGNIHINNSSLRCERTCDLINIKYADFAMVENCDLKGNEYPDTDALDYDNISNGIIRNNKIYGFYGSNSDGIDIGEGANNILIEKNLIFNCSDKGISVGQASSAIAKRNVIFNCNMGFGIKDSNSFVLIDQNTLFNNNYGIACYEKNYSAGGGQAIIKNTIIAGSRTSATYNDIYSDIVVSFSLSDTELMPGICNLLMDPEFVNPEIMNFELSGSSPCINGGDPNSPRDTDGSFADIGAYYVHAQSGATPDIVINEICYHPAVLTDSDDWVELYNNSSQKVDMSGWLLMDSKDDHIYHFPDNFSLNGNEYIVITADRYKFSTINPHVTNFRGNTDFRYSNGGEVIRLFNSHMTLIDYVAYDDTLPWPVEADGTGPTLQLKDPNYNNNLAVYWRASSNMAGTPGRANYLDSNELKDSDSGFNIYPNPARNYINFQISDEINKELTVCIRNIYGQELIKQIITFPNDNQTKTIDISELTKGIYLITLQSERFSLSEKFICR